MSNPFYTASGAPTTGAIGYSAVVRGEFALIAAGFALLPPTLTANTAVVINAGGTGMTVTTGTLALAGNFATTGAFNTTFVQQASVSVTLPTTSATMARTDAAQTFTGIQTFSTPIAASSVATMTATVGGGVPTPPNNTTTFLRGDGSWATVTLGITALTGDVTASGSGSVAATVAKIAGVAVGTPTGTGNVVFSASPVLTGTTTLGCAKTGGGTTASSGGYVTLYTPSLGGVQLVNAYWGNSQGGFCIVSYGAEGGDAIILQQLGAGVPGLTFQLSGNAIQAQRGDGGAATIVWSYVSLC